MPFAKVNDVTLYYEERGRGAPLLLIMGFGGDTRTWAEDFLTPLAAHWERPV
jgi:pimeloyl-ACP methyl ester carboxylesterase